MTDDTRHTLNESADKVRIDAKICRGTGTRDQDTFTIKARGETPKEALDNLDDTLRGIKGSVEFARSMQPEPQADE